MKKGFTLVEVLVVIVLLGILITFTSSSIIKIRNNTINNLHDSKITYIEVGAEDWGNDNLNNLNGTTCTFVTVEELLNGGYVIGDNEDKTEIIDPKTNQSLNTNCVCVKYVMVDNTSPDAIIKYEVTSEYSNTMCSN